MIRVIALGHRAGEIVDRLRATKEYNDVKFVYCNSNNDMLLDCGNDNDEHIHLTDIAQCREAINDDRDLMAVLVTCLGNDCDSSREYASEIMSELRSCADYRYCFATIPYPAGGQRDSAIEILNRLTESSDITVVQDDLKEPYNYFPPKMDVGLVRFLNLVLSPPRKGRISERDKLPFGIWATQKQLFMAMNAIYSNNMPDYYTAGTYSFHKNTHEH